MENTKYFSFFYLKILSPFTIFLLLLKIKLRNFSTNVFHSFTIYCAKKEKKNPLSLLHTKLLLLKDVPYLVSFLLVKVIS